MTDSASNPLGLSDEDFMNQASPSPAAEEPGQASTDNNQDQQTQDQNNQEGKTPAAEPAAADAVDETNKNPDADAGAASVVAPKVDGEAAPSGSDTNQDDKTSKEPKTPESEAKPGDAPAGAADKVAAPQAEAAPNFEDLYKQIMTPFTANGKKIELKDPQEAIQLMQMGANYTRKMQEIAPHRKLLTMLGNHGLLDESKLSFFISLDKKDPEAIKKLVMESGIDPLDIDTKIEPAYQEGSYAVTDAEVAFRTQLDELTSTDTGKQTLQVIAADWDQASQDMLWQNPQVMPIIHEQRENGVYAKITTEMDRRRTLGQLLPTTPFLEAYKIVGDDLQKAGAFDAGQSDQGDGGAGKVDNQSGASGGSPAPVVVATRAAEPRPVVENGDRAGAASPSRAAPGKAKEAVNFLSMSDDDFIKANQLEGRV